MNTLRQEFCDEINTPMGLDNEFDYIRWLEAKIQALRIHNVVQQSEQLNAFVEFYNNRKLRHEQIANDEIDIYLESI